jgi:hypothetical protein
MNRAQSLIVIGVLGLALGLDGCVEEQGSARPSEPTKERSAPAPAPSPAERAEAAVRSYYAGVNAADFRGAWNYFSPELQASQGGFEQWRDGYGLTVKTTLVSNRSVRASAAEAVVAIKLVGDAIDACGNDVSQIFQGTWTLRDLGGGFVGTELDVAQIGGGDLITDSNACAPPPSALPPSETVPVPDDSYEYDRPYPDLDCEDVGSDIPVGPDDPNGFDADGDGIGCES